MSKQFNPNVHVLLVLKLSENKLAAPNLLFSPNDLLTFDNSAQAKKIGYFFFHFLVSPIQIFILANGFSISTFTTCFQKISFTQPLP